MTHHDDDAVDCAKLESLIGDYVDDQLPQNVKGAVDHHMSQCAPCMAFLRQYRFAPDACRKMLMKAVPAEMEDRLLSFLRGKCTKKP